MSIDNYCLIGLISIQMRRSVSPSLGPSLTKNTTRVFLSLREDEWEVN